MEIDKKTFVLAIFIIVAIAPWAYIYSSYDGFDKIPTEDVRMFILMINYLILFAIGFFGIAYLIKDETEEEYIPQQRESLPPQRKRKVRKIILQKKDDEETEDNEDNEETEETNKKTNKKTNKEVDLHLFTKRQKEERKVKKGKNIKNKKIKNKKTENNKKIKRTKEEKKTDNEEKEWKNLYSEARK